MTCLERPGDRYLPAGLFVNTTEIYQFKVKAPERKDYAPYLSNMSKDFTIDNMKITGLRGVVKFFLSILTLLILTIFLVPIDI